MRHGPIVLVGWGSLLLVNAAVQLAFTVHVTQLALLGGAGAACVLAGLAWAAWQRWPRPGDVTLIPGPSHASAAVAVGLALAVIGAEAGPWLVLIGAGITTLGAGGVLRERRAERRG